MINRDNVADPFAWREQGAIGSRDVCLCGQYGAYVESSMDCRYNGTPITAWRVFRCGTCLRYFARQYFRLDQYSDHIEA